MSGARAQDTVFGLLAVLVFSLGCSSPQELPEPAFFSDDTSEGTRRGQRPPVGGGGDDESKDEGDLETPSVSLELLSESLTKVFCDRNAQCNGSISGPACVAFARPQIVQFVQKLIRGAAGGYIAYDPDLMVECIEQIHASPCPTDLTSEFFSRDGSATIVACIDAVKPNLSIGDACLPGFDQTWGACRDGYCAQTGNTCPGACVSYQKLGQSCDVDTKCDPVTAYCNGGECRPKGDLGGACEYEGTCLGNLVCRNHVCEGPPTAGTSCHYHDDCYGGDVELLCVSGSCVERIAEGESCSVFSSGPYSTGPLDACADGLRCESGVCVKRLADGSACEQRNDCFGERCLDGVCRSPVRIGEDCVHSGQCPWGSRCDVDSTGTCLELPLLGQDCTLFCNEGLMCVGGECVERPTELGDACATYTCFDGAYCDDGTCAPVKSPGEPCVDPIECDGGVCEAGVCVASC